MIDYKSMEKVIQDLNNYVDRLHETVKTQEKLDGTIEILVNLKNKIEEYNNEVCQYTKKIEVLEEQHGFIKNQFETVLYDYKKLHSAFELLDIELKKINMQNETERKALENLKKISDNIVNEVKNIKIKQEGLIKNQMINDKKNNVRFGILTGFAVAILVVVIIGFFV